jgi:hypothetical protein
LVESRSPTALLAAHHPGAAPIGAVTAAAGEISRGG